MINFVYIFYSSRVKLTNPIGQFGFQIQTSRFFTWGIDVLSCGSIGHFNGFRVNRWSELNIFARELNMSCHCIPLSPLFYHLSRVLKRYLS